MMTKIRRDPRVVGKGISFEAWHALCEQYGNRCLWCGEVRPRFDPLDDTRMDVAVAHLASLLGSLPAAQGVAMAVRELAAAQDAEAGN